MDLTKDTIGFIETNMPLEFNHEATLFNKTEDSFTDTDELPEISVTDIMALIPDSSTLTPTLLPPERNLSMVYCISEVVVALLAIFGNALVVYVFCKNRSLRRYRNYYIVALAIADFLVGLLGIPLAILASIGLPRNLHGCLFTVSILIVLCTVSILCLVAVSIDRYCATTSPFAYRNMKAKTAVSIILFCWVAGAIIGFLPLFGWYNRQGWLGFPSEYCFFTDVIDYNYLVFLYFATSIFPAALMIGFYGYIYYVVIRQKGTLVRQRQRCVSEQPSTGTLSGENRSATQVIRMEKSRRREVKVAKKLGSIIIFFMICSFPLNTINCMQAFYPSLHVPIQLINFCIILSHGNSALNPFLYAYHLKEFRLAMKNTLLSSCVNLSFGLVDFNASNSLGLTSRSMSMDPSVGHLAHTPNSSGKPSVKVRTKQNDKSAEISSPNQSNTESREEHKDPDDTN